RIRESFHGFLNDSVGLALVHLERADLIDEFVDDVAEIEGVQHAHAEIDRKLKAGLTACGLDAVGLLEQQNAEAVEPSVLEGKTIFRLIHAEAAWATGAGCEEDVIVDDLLSRLPLLLKLLQIPDQVAD